MTKKDKVTRIDRRITGWSVSREAPPAATTQDVNPLTLRIDRREEGSWESTTTKITLTSSSGRKTIYFVIGFGVVCGRMNGQPVCIERPLEFFVPAGQTAAEHQWVSATMRTLSLAARGGFLIKALADLRKVSWDRGPVWYGKTKSGKGLVHDSEVAAIAWAIQQELHKRGFLDELGNERPVEALAEHYARTRYYRDALPVDNPHVSVDAPAVPMLDAHAVVGQCPDPNCRGDMVMKDGCPTCLDCGYSKCG
ncbi:ribonucleoside-diphosphate reductase [Fontimonas sp. SYSU GA230001]|uniref:ribonucleoside-diphosphate reductase n=1 Tax=Fontimonas sp. SYSU GA230001 TaxID=3142450 RepID=UPI0032B45B4D